jgi:hypothetical protein
MENLGSFQTSPTTEKLDAALSKAQGEIENAELSKENPAFKRDGKNSKYADLTAIWGACRAALSKNGISVTQFPATAPQGRVGLFTRIAHEGQWMQSYCDLPVTQHTAHSYGSALTYLRRFMLAAVVGVAPDEDDDGNNASIRGGEIPQGESQKSSEQQRPRYTGPAGAYVVPFGKKWKGQSLAQMGVENVRSFAEYLEASAKEKGTPIAGPAAEYMEQALKYLKMVTPKQQHEDTPHFPSEEGPPWGIDDNQ